MLALFTFLLTIMILVGIHEWGHYWVARCCGVKVQRVALGFGKIIFRKRTSSGMELALGFIPLGGYVKLVDEREGPITAQDQPYAFNRQSVSKRLAILTAGPTINILFAILAFSLMYGIGFKTVRPQIKSVQLNSIAARAGIQAHYEITAVDGYQTQYWQQILVAIIARAGEQTTLHMTTQTAEGTTHHHILDLAQWQMNPLIPQPLQSLGITPYQPPLGQHWPREHIRTIQYPLLEALQQACLETWNFAKLNSMIIYKLIRRQLSIQSLTSPFSLVKVSETAFKQGFSVFMGFLAIFSVSLGVINLLPLPGLDGGHIIYCLAEALRRKPIALATQVLLFRLSLIFITVLLVQAFANDFVRWFTHL